MSEASSIYSAPIVFKSLSLIGLTMPSDEKKYEDTSLKLTKDQEGIISFIFLLLLFFIFGFC